MRKRVRKREKEKFILLGNNARVAKYRWEFEITLSSFESRPISRKQGFEKRRGGGGSPDVQEIVIGADCRNSTSYASSTIHVVKNWPNKIECENNRLWLINFLLLLLIPCIVDTAIYRHCTVEYSNCKYVRRTFMPKRRAIIF